MFDAPSFCDDYGINYYPEGTKNVSKGWIGIACPFCGDSSNHGGFNLSNGEYSCWKCGGHSLWNTIKALTDKSNIKEIIDNYQTFGFEQKVRTTLQGVSSIEVPGQTPLTSIGRTYLEGRNFDPDYLIGKYDLREGKPNTYHAYRIIIPIYYKYKAVSYQSRRIFKNDPMRYKNCPIEREAVHMKDICYNLDNCKRRTGVAVEGIPSVWRIGDDCFATFGTSFQPQQLLVIKEYFDKVFWLYDPEKIAQEKAKKAAGMISSIGVEVEIIGIEGYDDPDKLTQKDVMYLRKELKLY